jgi:hypothetical protein
MMQLKINHDKFKNRSHQAGKGHHGQACQCTIQLSKVALALHSGCHDKGVQAEASEA